MALNALRTEMVTFTGTPGIEINGITVGYKAEYTERTGTEAKYNSIAGLTTTILSDNGQYFIQLGEQLYDGDLRLNNTTDDFGRPCRHWEYDGKDVGTYIKKELLRQEWSKEVTGRMLYDVLTKPTIDDYDFTIAVDGVETVEANKNALGDMFFTKGNLIRSNTEGVGGTDNGVLTQVFVDTGIEHVYVSVINTYLAKATADYNEKKDEANFEVWSVEDLNTGTTNMFLVKDTDKKETMTVSGEDFDIEDVQKDDIVLVQVADGEIQTMFAPETVDNTEIDTFKKGDWVIAEGTQYDYASSIQYDDDVLDDYDQTNMKDTTYRIFLDQYGYAIGVEILEAADNYVFLTGIDGNTSNLTNKTADGNLIFVDGTMKTAKINMEKSRALNLSFATPGTDDPYTEFKPSALWNTWCTYSEDSDGVYTLTQVANDGLQMTSDDNGDARTGSRTTDKVGQGRDVVELAAPDAKYTAIIDKKHIGLNGLNGPLGTSNSGVDGTSSGYSKVYGNDDSVYINVSLKKITDASDVNPYGALAGGADTETAVIINDVDSVATGVQSVSLNAYDWAEVNTMDSGKYAIASANDNSFSFGVYTLFGDNGYVIAAVVVGEDDGVSSQYAYTWSNGADKEHWDKETKEWTWTKDVIINGEVVTLTEVGDNLSEVKGMNRNKWYEVKFKANGNVKSVNEISTNDADNHGEYVFCKTPEAANHPANGGGDYPKFVGKIELVQQAQVDNSGKVVLFEDMYTSNVDGEARGYVLSTEGTSFQVKNATGALVKGFAVSPNAKTVLVQDKQRVDADGNPIGSLSEMNNREYFTGGKAGLESAIKKLNLNKNETNKRFRGFVSAVFENGVAQTVIIYETDPNRVNWGTDITPSSITVNVANGKITVAPATAPGDTATDAQLIAVRNRLLQLGYTDIKINRNNAGIVTKVEATKDNITSEFSTVGLNAPTTVSSIAVTGTLTNTLYDGMAFDPTGLTIKATYDDGQVVTIANDDPGLTFAGDNSSSNILNTSDTTVTITYGGQTATVNVTVSARTVTGITATVTGKPKIEAAYDSAVTKTQLTGLSVEVTYNVGPTATVAGTDAGVDLDGTPKVGAKGDGTITVTYGGQTDDVTVEFEPTTTITVTGLTGYTVQGTPTLGGLKAGDTLDLTYVNDIPGATTNTSGNSTIDGDANNTVTVTAGTDGPPATAEEVVLHIVVEAVTNANTTVTVALG